jgi:hypothetical protein
MYRAALATGVVLLVTGVVIANGAPPRVKMIPAEHRIITDKEYPDYTFYLLSGGEKIAAVPFDPKTPVTITKAKPGEFDSFLLVAVPKSAAKEFENDKALRKAIIDNKIEGLAQAKSPLPSAARVLLNDKRTEVVQEHKVEKISAKDGIVFVTKDVEPKKEGDKKDSPDDDAPLASAPRGGVLIAGLAASLAALVGGMWLVGRTRRKG